MRIVKGPQLKPTVVGLKEITRRSVAPRVGKTPTWGSPLPDSNALPDPVSQDTGQSGGTLCAGTERDEIMGQRARRVLY